jgi:hypothetical protein
VAPIRPGGHDIGLEVRDTVSLVNEVADALKLVADGINNVRTIVEAARDAPRYLSRHYPNASDELASLLEELAKLVQLQAEASSVVTHFDFTVTGTDMGRQPSRFNDYLLEHKAVAERYRLQLDQTRTHCSQIGLHLFGLRTAIGKHGLRDIFGLWKAPQKSAQDAARLLEEVYSNDAVVLDEFQNMANAVDKALTDVRNALGGPGRVFIENVPQAANVLNGYAQQFAPVESNANYLAQQLRAAIVDTRSPWPPLE